MDAYTSLQNLVDNYNLQDFEKENVMKLIVAFMATYITDPQGTSPAFTNLAAEMADNLPAAKIMIKVIIEHDKGSFSNFSTNETLADIFSSE
jgi:hypothetical protein